MSQDGSKINCPECGKEIDVNDILYHQVDEQLKKQYKDELAKEKEKYDAQVLDLAQERKNLAAEKIKQQEEIANQVRDEVKKKEIDLKKKIKAEIEE
ncbi:MAG: DUF2130 domain-containing protein, partial [Gammaproteobacteria bacterium]